MDTMIRDYRHPKNIIADHDKIIEKIAKAPPIVEFTRTSKGGIKERRGVALDVPAIVKELKANSDELYATIKAIDLNNDDFGNAAREAMFGDIHSLIKEIYSVAKSSKKCKRIAEMIEQRAKDQPWGWEELNANSASDKAEETTAS